MHDRAGKLRLLARDEADVAVVSALLQDAIIPGADMEFNRKTNQYIIVGYLFQRYFRTSQLHFLAMCLHMLI